MKPLGETSLLFVLCSSSLSDDQSFITNDGMSEPSIFVDVDLADSIKHGDSDQLGNAPCALRRGIQNSMEAMSACHPALSTK